ncbi:MAG: LOG family protein [Candidatus Obscuribacterales bacterium]|nr:LOG family protein [Candidatus Obscuribacterales bacterium]
MTEAFLKPGATDVVPLSDEEAVTRVVFLAVENLWEAVNELTRLRRTHKEHYLVTIFGSARILQGTDDYERVKKLAFQLTGMGCGIITGGGPGLMEAANEGASLTGLDAVQRSIGIRVDLPFEKGANPFVGKAYEHKTFFSRLHHFVIMSDAFIVVPGGIGTMLELSMVWQLLQVRKLYDTPLILVGEMWAELVEWARKHMYNENVHLVNEVDLEIPICVKHSQDAIEIVRAHRQKWLKAHGRTE